MNSQEIREQLDELNRYYKAEAKLYSDYARHIGLPDTEFWIVYSLRISADKLTQHDLAALCAISKQTVNSALKSLMAKGYVELVAIEGNRKSKQVVLTPAGEQFVAENIDRLCAAEESVFSSLSQDERRMFVSLMTKRQAALCDVMTRLLG